MLYLGEIMRHYKLLLPEHLNNNGVLFGGNLLMWIDEFSYITASLDYPGNRFVTIGLDSVQFKEPIKSGAILCFDIELVKLGNSSVKYSVKVHYPDEMERSLFETYITFVNIEKESNKKAAIIKFS